MSKKNNKKIRTEFRKNHDTRQRKRDFTRDFASEDSGIDETVSREQLTGKGELTRKRTILGEQSDNDSIGYDVFRELSQDNIDKGTVVGVYGLACDVELDDGRLISCAIRGVLKSMSTEQRHVVVAGDVVTISHASAGEGVIERIEPRYGVVSRTSKGRQHIIVSNVDQLLIVGSAAEPTLKPNLIDRLIVTAEKSSIRPIICINKVDLIDLASLQGIMGVYSSLGYQVVPVSARTGFGVERLKSLVVNRRSVVSGQSGVGKSSLLNAIDPSLNLRTREVSSENQKGKHTTTTASLFRMSFGGYLIDTPGIRQFQLWDVIPQEVAGYYRDIRPFVNDCRFPDCTHIHEMSCAVKNAVADGKIDSRRYESYVSVIEGFEEEI